MPRLKILVVLTPYPGLYKALVALVAMAGDLTHMHPPVLCFKIEQPLVAMPFWKDTTVAVADLV